jgi:sugar lactone lactonase YvrE
MLGLAAVFATQSGVATAASVGTADVGKAGRVASDRIFPEEIELPVGFRPEGIAIGRLPFAYFGSLADGSIYRANLVTGRGRIISEGPGTPSVGLKIDDRGRLFVSGGVAGDARVVDARSGRVLASYPLATGNVFINDVVLTPRAAWFTDSRNPVLYKLPLGRHGELPDADEVEALPLTGDWVQQPGDSPPDANGIARTPDGRALLVIQSVTGFLFRVDPRTGAATRVAIADDVLLTNGDGLLLLGRTLYVVQNRDNQVAEIRLNRSGTAGRQVDVLTDERFAVPTTVAAYGDRLYLPNAQFGIANPDTAEYNAVAIRR